jgi:hypothetical protein
MAKTKTLVIKCNEDVRVVHGRNGLIVHVEEPHVDDALLSFNSDDLIAYVSNNYGVDEVYSEKELDKWAAENGYTKE